jgi:AcrR family transcriptional regulator
MMGYTPEHKARTRERVVDAAARLFRRYGYNGVGIDDIMAAANLTRGGFYAHFESKQDLFAAALSQELELARQLRRSADADRPRGTARALIDFYLDDANRARIARLCPLVSLSADVARCGADASAAYTATLRGLLEEIAERIPAAPADAQARALVAVALCVGGVVLAHAVSDDELAASLLHACRERAMSEVEGTAREPQ